MNHNPHALKVTLGCTIETGDAIGNRTKIAHPRNPSDWGKVRLIAGDWVYYRSHDTGRLRREHRCCCFAIRMEPGDIERGCEAIQETWTRSVRESRARHSRSVTKQPPDMRYTIPDYSRLEIAQPTGRKPSNR